MQFTWQTITSGPGLQAPIERLGTGGVLDRLSPWTIKAYSLVLEGSCSDEVESE